MVECIGEMRIAKKLTTTWTSQHCNWIEPTKQGNYTMKIHQKKSQKKVVVLELKEYSVHPGSWCEPFNANFVVDTEAFEHGGFRQVFKAKLVSSAKLEKVYHVIKEIFEIKAEQLRAVTNETKESQTRRGVHAHGYPFHCQSYD